MVLHRISFFGCPLKYCDPMVFPPQKPTNLPVRPRSRSSVHGCSRFIQNCKKTGVRHLILTPQSYHGIHVTEISEIQNGSWQLYSQDQNGKNNGSYDSYTNFIDVHTSNRSSSKKLLDVHCTLQLPCNGIVVWAPNTMQKIVDKLIPGDYCIVYIYI